MELLVIAVALAGGLEIRKLVVLTGVLFAPLALIGGIAFVGWRQRRVIDSRAAMFCDAVASDLRSGSPLGYALAAASSSVEEPALKALKPSTSPIDAAQIVGQAFSDVGPELEATIIAAARGGSQAADLFDEIGSLAIAQTEVSREVRVASAPARATALIFIGAPTGYLVLQVRSDRLPSLLAHPEQRVVALTGLALFLVGLFSAALLAWRAR